MIWPDLIHARRRYLPVIDEQFNDKIKFYFRKFENEYAGVEKREPAELRSALRAMENVYVNNAAALKYVQHEEDGPRIDEVGSYAYREAGRFGKWQTHLMLFPHEDGTAVLAHHEISPLGEFDEGLWHGIKNAVAHYNSSNGRHSPEQGVAEARRLLDLDKEAPFDGIKR